MPLGCSLVTTCIPPQISQPHTPVGTLNAWHNETRIEGHADRTVYGKARDATKSFFTHHLRLISLAANVGAAMAVTRWAKAAKSQLVRDVTLADFMPTDA